MKRVMGTLGLFMCAGCMVGDASQDRGDGELYWASGSTTDEGMSTHLFIVDRAVEILGRHVSLPRASRAYARLTDPACRPRWAAGLDDADHRPTYNNWYTWESHFFDPSTGTNYLGGTSPIAYGEAIDHLTTARESLADVDIGNGCYELGLALHYATDLTQPMHAANFASTDYPINLHSHLEDRAVEVQAQYTSTDWSSAPTAAIGTVLIDIAWSSHARWPAMRSALATAYGARCEDIDSYTLDHTSCWSGEPGVDAAIGDSLRQAQIDAAAFLYAADLP